MSTNPIVLVQGTGAVGSASADGLLDGLFDGGFDKRKGNVGFAVGSVATGCKEGASDGPLPGLLVESGSKSIDSWNVAVSAVVSCRV